MLSSHKSPSDTAEAGLGILQYADHAIVQGTYRSKNHFAGLLEMVLPITMACAFALLKNNASISRTLKACAVLILATAMVVALVDSLAKGGFVAALGGLLVMAMLGWAGSVSGSKRWFGFVALAVLFVLIFAFLPTDQLVSSFGASFHDTTAEGRIPIASDTLHLIQAYPVLGSGFGTYATAFLKYQTALVDLDFEFAHDDYLELFSELGVIGFVIFAALIVYAGQRAVRAALQQEDPDLRFLGLGCTGALMAIATHSFSDFNLYIPANTLLPAWIVGLATSLPLQPEAEAPAQLMLKPAWVLGSCLAIYAGGWLLFETKFANSPTAENSFCRFGVCDTDAAAHAGKLVEAVRREPAAPHRWCDLGEAMLKSGDMAHARYCFSRAVVLARTSLRCNSGPRTFITAQGTGPESSS